MYEAQQLFRNTIYYKKVSEQLPSVSLAVASESKVPLMATTDIIDRGSYLFLLSNNLFDQTSFLIIWLWLLGLMYRSARIRIPVILRLILMKKV